MINASPFQSGLVIASYKPLVSCLGSTDYSGGNIDTAKASRNGQLMGYSQRMHVDLFPQTNEGGVLSMPFVHHQNWLNLSGTRLDFTEELKKMGRINLTSVSTLNNCSGTAGSHANISVYVWATDVQLSGPAYEVQSDEYSDRPVSFTASAVAAMSGALVRVPVIGPYALATNIASAATASIARIFGYSNVPTLSNTIPNKIRTVGNLANTQVGEVIEPLTLDPKNELSIDPRTVGYDGADELLISNYAGRESFFTTFDWLGTYPSDTEVFKTYVTPELANIDTALYATAGSYKVVSMTPAGHIAQLFRKWRGPVRLKFKVLASRYHRGRLRITYDPNGSLSVDAVKQINKIWDISTSSEIEIEVPYMGSEAFKFAGHLATYVNQVPTLPLFGGYGSTLPTYSDGYFNGVLRIHVINELTAPDTTNGVVVACYISAPDVEFAEPHNIEQQYFNDVGLVTHAPIFTYLDPYDIQSDEGPMPDSIVSVPCQETLQGEAAYTIYMGEVVKSLRTVMQRTVRHAQYMFRANTTIKNYFVSLSIITPRFPRMRGRTAAGQNSIKNSSVSTPYNLCRTHPMTWIVAAFVGWRGSVNWRARFDDTFKETDNLSISRKPESIRYDSNRFINATYLPLAKATASSVAKVGLNATECDFNGFSMVAGDVEPVVSARVPMYSQHRMYPANPVALNDVSEISYTGLEYDNIVIGCYGQTFSDVNREMFSVETFVSAGHDFTPFVFVNVPTVYSYQSNLSEKFDSTFDYPTYTM
ncbi:hypothetical protein 2 [Beihai razor shell virus 2]|uniref:hypothetical protein 2 n=1 Tax=Beihai razor shell virus 2 TaxID=1922646 RepID=UPI00090A90B1|nr:hypothetical protein 2 [Beihai razor shell virus 2]APG76698.1 hypothetical protein 2 [Beihai razor shell virus 2]APG78904.1 hypothetical protein 2 [Beihai razor shell virus 2]